MADKKDRILVIEDNKDVLGGILELLEYSGYKPTGSPEFSDKIFEQFKAGYYDLLILDIMLSGTDGRELAKRLKSVSETKNIPIILISAYTNLEDTVKESMADDFLQKPFGLEELQEKVEPFLENSDH